METDALSKADLALINAYNPGLSATWLFQRAMSIRSGQPISTDFINMLLSNNFAAMERRGDPVLKPFLQDVVQFGPLAATLAGQVASDAAGLVGIVKHVGLPALADFSGHFAWLALSTVLWRPARDVVGSMEEAMTPQQRY